MKGQLRFDEFMNISEEKPKQETSRCAEQRIPMVDPCYYCLCNSCINNAESTTVNLGNDNFSDDWEECFFCGECRKFDGDTQKRNMEREQCARYEIDNYHAEQKRKKFKVIGGERDENQDHTE